MPRANEKIRVAMGTSKKRLSVRWIKKKINNYKNKIGARSWALARVIEERLYDRPSPNPPEIPLTLFPCFFSFLCNTVLVLWRLIDRYILYRARVCGRIYYTPGQYYTWPVVVQPARIRINLYGRGNTIINLIPVGRERREFTLACTSR